MDTTSLAALFRDITSILAPIGGLSLVVSVLWIIVRTGSTHVLRNRIWHLLHGQSEPSDPTIKSFIEDQNDLMSFRYASGLRARTLEQCRKLSMWLKANDEAASTIRSAGHYFDLEKLHIKEERLPGRSTQGWAIIVGAVLVLLTVLPAQGLVANKALMQLKESGQWLTATSTAMRAITWPRSNARAELTALLCSEDHEAVARRTQFSKADVGILCDVFKNPQMPGDLAEIVKEQRLVSAFVMVMFIVLAYIPLKFAVRVDAARAIARRLQERLSNGRPSSVE